MPERMTMKNEVKLSVGSTGESIYLLRTVLASLAARLDFSLDEIDDLALAVSEAAAFLLGATKNPGRLSMRVGASEMGIQAILSADAPNVMWPPQNVEDALAWKILSALTDEADFVSEGGGPGIRLLKAGSAGETAK